MLHPKKEDFLIVEMCVRSNHASSVPRDVFPLGRFSSELAQRPVEAQLGFVVRRVYSALEGGASLV